ncbi:MAG: gamma-glutamylcyclotransferase [Proteobacteria bacterium]|nr:gamma-glutamylcyclotransferase [Pseudomonadota bacterium]
MTIELFVNGTLMRGLGLHENLDGAEFLGAFTTEPCYRLYSIDDIHPGMFKVAEGGVGVKGEMYRMSDEIWRRVEEGEPPHLYCGPVQLDNGETVDGILFPQDIAEAGHKDISEYGDWREYIASREA